MLKEKVSRNDGLTSENPSFFRSIAGSLLYLTETRPNIIFSTMLLSRYMSNPSDIHQGMAKRVLRYLKRDFWPGYNVCKKCEVQLEGYIDSEWAGCIDDNKSTSGYVFNIETGAVCWNARKREVVAQSIVEAEYIALSAATNHAIWQKNLLADLGHIESFPTLIYCDNKSNNCNCSKSCRTQEN